jgi:hypothetical protein
MQVAAARGPVDRPPARSGGFSTSPPQASVRRIALVSVNFVRQTSNQVLAGDIV